MADLAYTTDIQDEIAYLLKGNTYSSLTTAHKNLIDGSATPPTLAKGVAYAAMQEVRAIGQWFQLSGTLTAPIEFQPWFVMSACHKAAIQIAPDRIEWFREQVQSAMVGVLDAYTPVETDFDVGSTPEGSTLTVDTVRRYCIRHCARLHRWETIDDDRRMKPRLFVPPEVVDTQLERVIRNLWKRSEWRFRKRKTKIAITRYSVEDATWTNGTLTLTKTSGFSTSIPNGSRCRVSAGTGATTGEYVVTSATANTVVLETTIGSAADGQTDIDATVFSVTFPDLASETYDGVATRELYYSDETGRNVAVKWVEDDDLQRYRAWNPEPARPIWFQTERKGTVYRWHLAPFPDASYDLFGSVYVAGPTIATSNAATNTAIQRFPVEFYPHIKDLTLAEVLTHYGDRNGEVLRRRIDEEIEGTLASFVDEGRADDDQMIRDVYKDVSDISGTEQFLGGQGF